VYVDFNSSSRPRYLKDSARWYAQYIDSAGAAVPEHLPPQQRPSRTAAGDSQLMGGGLHMGGPTQVDLVSSARWSATAVMLLISLLTLYARYVKRQWV
jgi:hypothetical protein